MRALNFGEKQLPAADYLGWLPAFPGGSRPKYPLRPFGTGTTGYHARPLIDGRIDGQKLDRHTHIDIDDYCQFLYVRVYLYSLCPNYISLMHYR